MENSNEHNIWPSFVDLSISFVVILTLVLAVLIYNSAESKKKYEKVSKQQIKIEEEAMQLLEFSKIYGDSSYLDLTLDSSKTILIIGFKENQEIIFNSGSIMYTNNSKANMSISKLTSVLGQILEQKEMFIGRIMVEGHTDMRPISTSSRNEFKSNWELSAARAGKVVREFLGDKKNGPLAGFYQKFVAMGYADTQPTGKGFTSDRRITIKISTATAEKLANSYSIDN